MKRSFFSMAVLLMAGAAFALFNPASLVKTFSPAVRSVEFHYTATVNHLSTAATLFRLWLPLPTSDDHQTITDIKVECPYSYTIQHEPQSGNSMLYVEVPEPKVPSFTLDVDFKVRRNEVRTQVSGFSAAAADALWAATVPPPNLDSYLQPNVLIPTSGRIRDLALQVTAGKETPLAKARAIYDYVTHTLHYDHLGAGWGRGDAVYACDAKHGNCTDFHSLFIAMARSVGIPARFDMGFALPDDQSVGPVSGYHCWAEFYAPGIGWIPVDSSQASVDKAKVNYLFGALDANRVLFTRGRDLLLMPAQKSQPLNYFIYPYAEVDGRPFTDISRNFSFKDLP